MYLKKKYACLRTMICAAVSVAVWAPAESEDMLMRLNGLSDGGNLCCCGTVNMDYRIGGRLICCGVIDILGRGLFSNYFYHIWRIQEYGSGASVFSAFCKVNNIQRYYLGYWVKGCGRMEYKTCFKPYQRRQEGRRLDR